MINFDEASIEQLKQAETFVTFELIKKGYEPIVSEHDGWTKVELNDVEGNLVMGVVGIDYVDCITMIGAKLTGEQ